MEVTDDEVNAFVDLYREETGHQLYRNRTRMGLEQFVAKRLENAFQPDIPPHKSLNERVAKLEAESATKRDITEAIRGHNSGIWIHLDKKFAEAHTKIDTHIHHNVNDGHTGTAIYPVGKTKADDARWEQVALAARQQGMGTYYASNFHALPIVKAAVDKAVELGLVSRREPVVVTDEDARKAWSMILGNLSYEGARAALQAFADRINGENHA